MRDGASQFMRIIADDRGAFNYGSFLDSSDAAAVRDSDDDGVYDI